jgi:hypothetical protein
MHPVDMKILLYITQYRRTPWHLSAILPSFQRGGEVGKMASLLPRRVLRWTSGRLMARHCSRQHGRLRNGRHFVSSLSRSGSPDSEFSVVDPDPFEQFVFT